jgi:hypothetical protein
MSEHLPASLSPKAFADLKEIVLDEFGPDHTGQEIEEMGLRLLGLFNLLMSNTFKAEGPKLSGEEAKGLAYVTECLKQQKQPTVRGVAEAIGKRSSRSGMRMVDELVKRGTACPGRGGKDHFVQPEFFFCRLNTH